MKLKELVSVLKKATKDAGGCDVDVEFWLDEEPIQLEKIGQFGVVPDVAFHFKKFGEDGK